MAQLFKSEDADFGGHRDRVLVFDRPGVLPKLSQGAQNLIPVAFDREVERYDIRRAFALVDQNLEFRSKIRPVLS